MWRRNQSEQGNFCDQIYYCKGIKKSKMGSAGAVFLWALSEAVEEMTLELRSKCHQCYFVGTWGAGKCRCPRLGMVRETRGQARGGMKRSGPGLFGVGYIFGAKASKGQIVG